MRGLDVLRRHGVDWNVLTTIHAANGDHGRRGVHVPARRARARTFIQFIPIIERATEATLTAADAGWGGGVKGRPLYIQDGDLVTRPLDRPAAVRPLPDRRVRGVGPPRHRHGVRADVRHRAGELVRRARRDVRARRDLRAASSRWSTTATCTPAITSSSRTTCSATSATDADAGAGRLARASASSGRTSATRLTRYCLRLRCPFRLPRRLPQGPVRHLALRRARPALPVPRLQGLLPPHRRADAARWRRCSPAAGHPPS